VSSRKPKSIRYKILFAGLIALFGVLVLTPPLPSRVGAQSSPHGLTKAEDQMTMLQEKMERSGPISALIDRHEKLLPQVGEVAQIEAPTASRTEGPSSPVASELCFPASGSSIDGSEPTYNRPELDTPPSFCFPSVTGTAVHFDQYTFSLSGCATSDVTVSLLGTSGAPCDVAGSLADTFVTVYQKPGGESDTPGSPIFVQSDGCDNLFASNDDLDLTEHRSELTVSLSAGFFVVVVSPFNNTDTGTYALNVAAVGPGCTITNPPTAADGAVSGTITDNNGASIGGVTIQLNGTASRKTITDANGHYSFADVETNGLYTITPSRVNYTFSPQNRTFSLLGMQTDASFTAAANSGSHLNPLDSTEYLVRQQYLDFLGREPDESGFAFWISEINSCGNDQGCIERKRINVSAAFFLSIEFQQTGYEMYRMYKAAYGDLPGAAAPVRFSEFMTDTPPIAQGVVVNQAGWQQTLESNTQRFATEFVQRARFTSAYLTTMTPAQFVDKLFANAGVTPTRSERTTAISEFGSAATSSDAAARGRALRRVAENSVLAQQEFNRAFVLMQYFGYLRRDPNSGPDADFTGYNFWLNKLNQFNGDFVAAEMVKAFIVSGEYRQKFAP